MLVAKILFSDSNFIFQAAREKLFRSFITLIIRKTDAVEKLETRDNLEKRFSIERFSVLILF